MLFLYKVNVKFHSYITICVWLALLFVDTSLVSGASKSIYVAELKSKRFPSKQYLKFITTVNILDI